MREISRPSALALAAAVVGLLLPASASAATAATLPTWPGGKPPPGSTSPPSPRGKPALPPGSSLPPPGQKVPGPPLPAKVQEHLGWLTPLSKRVFDRFETVYPVVYSPGWPNAFSLIPACRFAALLYDGTVDDPDREQLLAIANEKLKQASDFVRDNYLRANNYSLLASISYLGSLAVDVESDQTQVKSFSQFYAMQQVVRLLREFHKQSAAAYKSLEQTIAFAGNIFGCDAAEFGFQYFLKTLGGARLVKQQLDSWTHALSP